MCTVSINIVCWCDCSSFRTVHEEWYFPTTQSSSLACFSSGLGSKCPFSSRSKTVSCLIMLRGWGMSVQLLLLCFALNPPKWYLGSAVVGAAGCSVWRSGSPLLFLDYLLQAEPGPVFRNCGVLLPLEFNCWGFTNDQDPLWLVFFGPPPSKYFHREGWCVLVCCVNKVVSQ